MKVDINLTEIDSHAIEYIVDLIEKDAKDNEGNSIRGFSLFQEVHVVGNLLKQELVMARRKESADA